MYSTLAAIVLRDMVSGADRTIMIIWHGNTYHCCVWENSIVTDVPLVISFVVCDSGKVNHTHRVNINLVITFMAKYTRSKIPLLIIFPLRSEITLTTKNKFHMLYIQVSTNSLHVCGKLLFVLRRESNTQIRQIKQMPFFGFSANYQKLNNFASATFDTLFYFKKKATINQHKNKISNI